MRFIVTGSLCLLISVAAWAGPIAHVPSPAGREARFSVTQDDRVPRDAAGTRSHVLRAGQRDGARAVIDGAAVVSALAGSRLRLNLPASNENKTPALLLELERGTVRVHVGSTPVHLALGSLRLVVRQAELLVLRQGGLVYVQLSKVFADGSAVVQEVAAPSSTALPEAAALPEAIAGPEPVAPPQPVQMSLDQVLLFSPDRPPAAAQGNILKVLNGALARLTHRRTGPQLKGQSIEDPRDLKIISQRDEALLSEIELEDIEVEAGCVEICID